MQRRCSHPACRTTLDEYPVECPHGLPFCGGCVFEDACGQCNTLATAWDAPFTPDPTSPAGQSCIDTAAEERKDRDRYEYGQLLVREMDARW